MALLAGFAPASIRLEDECLVYFGHGSRKIGVLEWWNNGAMSAMLLHHPRTPLLHYSIPKLVSAAGVAPAITWSQAKHVAATLRADGPDGCFIRAGETQDTNPGKILR